MRKKRFSLLPSIILLWIVCLLIPLTAQAAGRKETEPNNNFQDANSILLNQSVSGTVDEYEDYDYYIFQVAEPGVISVTIETAYRYEGNPITVYVQQARENTVPLSPAFDILRETNWVPEDDFGYRHGPDPEFGEYTGYHIPEKYTTYSYGIGTGTFYLLVRQMQYEPINYTVTLNYRTADDWEQECNDDFIIHTEESDRYMARTGQDATPIVTNKTYHGTTDAAGRNDWYCFTLEQPTSLSLGLTHEPITWTAEQMHKYRLRRPPSGVISFAYAAIYKVDSIRSISSQLCLLKCARTNTEDHTEVLTLDAGTYYVRVHAVKYYGYYIDDNSGGFYLIEPYTLKLNTENVFTSETLSVSGIESKTYTGKAVTQKPVVKLGSKTLKQGQDYTLSYKNNTQLGIATVTINGCGKYAGSVSRNFRITAPVIVTARTSLYTSQTGVATGGIVAEGTALVAYQKSGGENPRWKVRKNGAWYWIDANYLYDTTTKKPTAADRIGQGVSTKAVYVYASPTTKSAKIATLRKGTLRNLYAQSGNWYQIYTGGKYGWVRVNGFDYTKALSSKPVTRIRTTTALQTFYGPGTDYLTSIVVPPGKELNIYKIKGKWYLVYKTGKYLWVRP